MLYEVCIDAYTLNCEVTWIDESGVPGIDTSDWDAQGYRELEFRVISGKWTDEQGTEIDAGRNACAELSELFAEYIETELWKQIDADRGEPRD